MNFRELVEKRNKLLVDARTAMQGENVDAETRSKVDAMLADANTLKADIERMEASAETEQRSLPTNTPPRGAVENHSGKDERSFEERNAASNVALRALLKGDRYEQRDLTLAANGGVMIPVAAVSPIQTKKSPGSIMDIVRRLRTTTGEDVRQPLWDDTGNGFVLDSASLTTTDPAVTGVTIKVDGLRSNPILLDNKLVQDVSYDLVSDVYAAIQLRYIRSVSQAIVAGNGSNFTALSAPSALTSVTASVVKYADLVGLLTALDPAYTFNACWSFSNATLGSILNIADTGGRPIFLPFNDGGTSGFVGTLFGYPVKIDQYAPTVATGNLPIRFGDHSAAYTLREVEPGIVIKTTDQRYIELNRLGVVAFARAGGAPTVVSAAPSLVSLTVTTALLEAKVAADHLQQSLAADVKELQSLLKEHNVNALMGAIAGVGGTGDSNKEITKLGKQVEDEGVKAHLAYNEALASAGADQAKREAATKAYYQRMDDIAGDAARQMRKRATDIANEQKRLDAAASHPDRFGTDRTRATDLSPQRTSFEDAAVVFDNVQRRAKDSAADFAADKELGSAKQHKGDDGAAKKAAEEQMKSFERMLNLRKENEKVGVGEEIAFWAAMLAPAQKYADNVDKINAKLGSLNQEFYRLNDEDAKKAVEAQKRKVEQTKRDFADLLAVATDWERQDEAKSNSAARLDEAQSRATIAMREWSISQQAATGVLTKHDAAVQMATLHASDYAKQLAELDAEEKADLSRSTLTDDERSTRKNNRDVKRTEIISKRDITAAQDGVNIVATTWQGAMKNANAAWVQDARDSAKQVADLYKQALDGFNSNLVNAMTGDKTDWSGMAKGLSKTLAGDALKHVEAPILGAFGISGKADGSDANPWSVKVVGAGSMQDGLVKGMSGIFGGDGNDSVDDSGGGGWLKKIGSFATSLFGGHKALGGGVKAGVTYDVGEMGREEFTPSVDGVITPHNKSGGNVTYYNVQVADGVTPEQMKMHVRSELMAYHQNVMPQGARAAVSDGRNRSASRR